MNKQEMHPKDVIVDLVLRWTPKVTGVVGTVATVDAPGGLGGLGFMLFARNHLEQFVQLTVYVALSGETHDGSEPGKEARWVLFKIAPGVWKLSQSIVSDRLHAYVTIVGVPEPAPWEKTEAASTLRIFEGVVREDSMEKHDTEALVTDEGKSVYPRYLFSDLIGRRVRVVVQVLDAPAAAQGTS